MSKLEDDAATLAARVMAYRRWNNPRKMLEAADHLQLALWDGLDEHLALSAEQLELAEDANAIASTSTPRRPTGGTR